MNRSALRAALYVIGGMLAAAAALMALAGCLVVAAWLAIWAAVLTIGLLIERWRYKELSARMPGPGWQTTGERFVDPETDRLVTVYFNPTTGERRYIAA
jgi:hypothetical protein